MENRATSGKKSEAKPSERKTSADRIFETHRLSNHFPPVQLASLFSPSLLLLFCYHFRGSILGRACVHSSAPNQRLKQSAKNPPQGVGLNESIITKPVNGLIASCFARPTKWQGCTIMPTHRHNSPQGGCPRDCPFMGERSVG